MVRQARESAFGVEEEHLVEENPKSHPLILVVVVDREWEFEAAKEEHLAEENRKSCPPMIDGLEWEEEYLAEENRKSHPPMVAYREWEEREEE